MVQIMLQSTHLMLQKWSNTVEARGGSVTDFNIDEDLRTLTGDIIAKACFGSSYNKGKEIFSKIRTLQKAMSSQQGLLFSGVPTFR